MKVALPILKKLVLVTSGRTELRAYILEI